MPLPAGTLRAMQADRDGRLEFVGNTTTRDKVLRREFRVAEGQPMNMGLFEASVYKVNALGYWKLEEEPLEFDFDDGEWSPPADSGMASSLRT